MDNSYDDDFYEEYHCIPIVKEEITEQEANMLWDMNDSFGSILGDTELLMAELRATEFHITELRRIFDLIEHISTELTTLEANVECALILNAVYEQGALNEAVEKGANKYEFEREQILNRDREYEERIKYSDYNPFW